MLRAVMPVARESSSMVSQSAAPSARGRGRPGVSVGCVGSVTGRAYRRLCHTVTCYIPRAMFLPALTSAASLAGAVLTAAVAPPAGGAATREVIEATTAAGVLS